MKKITILFLFILNFSYSQTKEETINWLNLKLKENSDSYMGEYSIKIQKDKDWGETLVISVRIKNDYMSEHYEQYSFLPKNITSVITTKKFRNDGKLGLIISAKGENIYLNSKKFVSEIEILCTPAPDETIIRIQKGFIHLLNLMGNPIKITKELFND